MTPRVVQGPCPGCVRSGLYVTRFCDPFVAAGVAVRNLHGYTRDVQVFAHAFGAVLGDMLRLGSSVITSITVGLVSTEAWRPCTLCRCEMSPGDLWAYDSTRACVSVSVSVSCPCPCIRCKFGCGYRYVDVRVPHAVIDMLRFIIESGTEVEYRTIPDQTSPGDSQFSILHSERPR